jgi:uncharacterized protein
LKYNEEMQIFEPYTQLLNDLEKLTAALAQKHATNLTCQAGCSGCCLPGLSVFAVEAAHLSEALTDLADPLRSRVLAQAQAAQAAPEQQSHCPLLVDDLCSIYNQRPVICRSHGYPIHFQDPEAEEGEVFLDVCPLNFTAEGALENLDLPDTLPIDRLNLRLAAINHVYCRDVLQTEAERVDLAVLAVEVLGG